MNRQCIRMMVNKEGCFHGFGVNDEVLEVRSVHYGNQFENETIEMFGKVWLRDDYSFIDSSQNTYLYWHPA